MNRQTTTALESTKLKGTLAVEHPCYWTGGIHGTPLKNSSGICIWKGTHPLSPYNWGAGAVMEVL